MKLNPFFVFYVAIVLGIILMNLQWGGKRTMFMEDRSAFFWRRY